VTLSSGDVILKAKDSGGVEHALTNGGYWGQPGGFALPVKYEATTDWTLNFAVPGEYTITFRLVDLASAGALIALGRKLEPHTVTAKVSLYI
jgi:hypothetical protein